MELQLGYMASNVFIFDIDGCIMPNVFSLKEKTSVHALSLLSLYPEFVEFYKQCCPGSLAIYFLTGRKQTEHGEITEEQLKPLRSHKEFTIIYYPKNKSHNPEEYFQWKADSIKAIMNQWDNPKVRFNVYDDLEGLFPVLHRKVSRNLKDYRIMLIQSRADWIKEARVRISSLLV
jgi:hypothetical protein